MTRVERYILTGLISFAIVYGLGMISPMFDNLLTVAGTLVIVDSLFSKDYSFPERILSSGFVFMVIGLAISAVRILTHLVMP